MESGPIFEWKTKNPIADNDEDAEQIKIATENAKYEDSSEENNKELDDHSKRNGNKWEYDRLIEHDEMKNIVPDGKTRV